MTNCDEIVRAVFLYKACAFFYNVKENVEQRLRAEEVFHEFTGQRAVQGF